MVLFDLPHEQLVAHTGSARPPDDLADFWKSTLSDARSQAGPPDVVQVATGIGMVDTFDVTFSGFAGHPVRAWLHLPASRDGPLPLVVRYQGYGGGRGLAHQVGPWPLTGAAFLQVDTRGQGSASTPGDTPDPGGSGPAHPGYLTRGLHDPADYYYRRVYTDAVLAVDAAGDLPGVDAARVAVMGASQGGAITIAVAALRDDIVAALPDVVFMSDHRRAVEVTDAAPYGELRTWLAVHRDQVERAFDTLAYFDVAVLARWATAPALFSVALMDETCPPSTVYAAINAWAGAKEVIEYPFNDHEGGEAFHEATQLRWLPRRLGLA